MLYEAKHVSLTVASYLKTTASGVVLSVIAL